MDPPLLQLVGVSRDEAALVAVIGPPVRDRLFAAEVDPVGEHIEINGLHFVVKGVLTRHPGLVGEGEIFVTDPEQIGGGRGYMFGCGWMRKR